MQTTARNPDLTAATIAATAIGATLGGLATLVICLAKLGVL